MRSKECEEKMPVSAARPSYPIAHRCYRAYGLTPARTASTCLVKAHRCAERRGLEHYALRTHVRRTRAPAGQLAHA